jgi:hypothetical protein
MIHPSLSSQVTTGGDDAGDDGEGAGGAVAHAAQTNEMPNAQSPMLNDQRRL